jgi:hypothetical protein
MGGKGEGDMGGPESGEKGRLREDGRELTTLGC